jgi:hypothetical protein
MNQTSTNEEDCVKFIEKKKLKVARDDDLRLVIHIEQEGAFNHAFLSAYLNHRTPKCPYSQVFCLGQIADHPHKWRCVQVYPDLVFVAELDETAATALVLDREQYNKHLFTGEH